MYINIFFQYYFYLNFYIKVLSTLSSTNSLDGSVLHFQHLVALVYFHCSFQSNPEVKGEYQTDYSGLFIRKALNWGGGRGQGRQRIRGETTIKKKIRIRGEKN